MTVNATAIWRVRPSGSNTNGGGYDPGISGAATDYSQQNSAQATGTTGTSTASTTFTDAGGAFTSAMIGNALWLASATGTPTVGAYFITAVGSATSVTLDRASGTYTAAHYAVGGGWADFWTNTTSSGPTVAGNVVYTLGSGTPNPASYSFDYIAGSAFTNVSGVNFYNDPGTPGYLSPPNTTGGMPCIKVTADNVWTAKTAQIQGLWFVCNSSGLTAGDSVFIHSAGNSTIFGCVFDQNAVDYGLIGDSNLNVIGCECFSSVAPGSAATTNSAIFVANDAACIGCNIHDVFSVGVNVAGGDAIGNIIAKCRGSGIYYGGTSNVYNNTIDGNLGNAINMAGNFNGVVIVNNIISNHTGAGKSGISAATLTGSILDYNVFYNNTANYGTGIVAGPHDTALGVTPYVGSATENYSLV